MSEQVEGRSERWLARSRTGFFVSVLSFAIPIVLSVVAVYGASKLLPHPSTDVERALWWIAILLISLIAAIVGERLARPLLPLASLLKMSLLFPDRAPSRFAVAWRSGSTRQLDRYVHGLDQAGHREPVETATQILGMVTALSSHDRRTRGHSERVRAYTDLLADELRLSQHDRDRLRWSALLHDVGKIAVDVEILNKPGAPSPDEWEILHQHPLEGKRMIEPLSEWLGEWGLAVEQHHENFDGTGYPYGIAGDQISLGARIVAVADSFEVMTAVRSYKSPMSPRDARKELTRCAGTQFDPAIVRAFLNISVGRQRWVIGPIAWLFDLPIVSQLSNLGSVVAATSQVAIVAGSVALGTTAAGGLALMHAHPVVSAASSSSSHVAHHPTGNSDPTTTVASSSQSAASASGTTTTLSSTTTGTTSPPASSATSTTSPPAWSSPTTTTTNSSSSTTTTNPATTTTTTKPSTTTTTTKPSTVTTTTMPPPTTTTTKPPPTTTTTKPPPTTTTTKPPPTTTTTFCILIICL